MAFQISVQKQKDGSNMVMSRQCAAIMIRICKNLIKDYPNAAGCIYQRLIAEMETDTWLLRGLPCWECRKLIELGESCVRKRTNQSSKYYHTACGKAKNVI